MTLRELSYELDHILRQGDTGPLPVIINTEDGPKTIQSVIIRPDDFAPYCTVIELSTKKIHKEEK